MPNYKTSFLPVSSSTYPTVTTPTGVPTLSAALGPAGSQSIVLTYNYQGSDDSGFEIEELDPNIGPNYQLRDTPGALAPNTSGTDTISGLNGGDTYTFRIRADHTDGTVSNYAGGASETIPIANAPSLSVTNVTITGGDGPEQAIRVGWSGILVGQDVAIQEMSSAIPGNTWSTVWYGDQGSGNWPATDGSGYAINPGTFGGGSYTYHIATKDSYGNWTAWSEPQTKSLAGDPGPAPDLAVNGTTITATWPVDDGPQAVLMEPDGTASLIGNGASLPYMGYGQLSDDGTTYTAVRSNLLPGTKYDFVLWTPSGSYEEPITEFGQADETTAGTPPTTAPAAPQTIHTKVDLNLEDYSKNVVHLAWTNTSANEDQFIIDRSSDGGKTWTNIGSTSFDNTTWDDKGTPHGDYIYRVTAKNVGGSSSSTTNVHVDGTWNEIAPDVLTLIQNAANVDLQVAKKLSPTIAQLNHQGARGEVFTSILAEANLKNANANLISLLFSPRAALDVGIAATNGAFNAVINQNGFVGRAAKGRFAALASSTKLLIKFVDYSSIGLPVLDWFLNTGVANVRNVNSTAQLLDGASTASSAATVAALGLISIFNDAESDGASLDNLFDSLNFHICTDSPDQIAALRKALTAHLADLKQFQQNHANGWNQLDALAGDLKTELDTLAGFIGLANQ